MLAQQLLLYGGCQWVQIIALNLNFPLKFIRIISSRWIKDEKESKKIGCAQSIYSWSRIRTGNVWQLSVVCWPSGHSCLIWYQFCIGIVTCTSNQLSLWKLITNLLQNERKKFKISEITFASRKFELVWIEQAIDLIRFRLFI